MTTRRQAALAFALSASGLAGCASRPAPDMRAEAPYCHRNNRGRVLMCTRTNAPSLERDAEAKRFAPQGDALTVYVVRNVRGEDGHALDVSLDGALAFETVPKSMLRFRVRAGEHRLAFKHDGKTYETIVRGRLGDVVFAGVTGSDWAWGSSHGWSDESAEALKQRALTARLVGDHSFV